MEKVCKELTSATLASLLCGWAQKVLSLAAAGGAGHSAQGRASLEGTVTNQLTGSPIVQCLLSTYYVLLGEDDNSQRVTGGYSERCCAWANQVRPQGRWHLGWFAIGQVKNQRRTFQGLVPSPAWWGFEPSLLTIQTRRGAFTYKKVDLKLQDNHAYMSRGATSHVLLSFSA